MAHHCPSKDGWDALTLNWDWSDWGVYLKEDGRWAGGLEVSAMNMCLQLPGIDKNVNIWKKDINYLCEDRLDENTILLMLSYNHFTYLREINVVP